MRKKSRVLAATGIIAAQFVKSAPHDGYTVLIGTGSQMSVLPALKPNVPFDAEKDFVPISLLGTTPYVLLVNSSVPAKTLPELIALLRANPEKFNYSTSGFGSLPHLAGEMFKRMAKVDMTHVPYPGNSPATTAVVSGVVQITFDSPISSLPHVQAGTLRAAIFGISDGLVSNLALVMGVAVAGMHFIGMASAHFVGIDLISGTAEANGIELAYQTFGSTDDRPLLHTTADGAILEQFRDPALAGLRQIQSSLDGRRLYGLVAAGVLMFDLPEDFR